MNYTFWWAYEEPLPAWYGPYQTQRQAVFAAQRDGNAHRVVNVKSMAELGGGARMDTGHSERFPANSIDKFLRGA